jgi:hypothetical protein
VADGRVTGDGQAGKLTDGRQGQRFLPITHRFLVFLA